jgi:hypothetical protein
LQEIEDSKLGIIEHKIEVVVNVKEMKDAVRSWIKELEKSYGDAITHTI